MGVSRAVTTALEVARDAKTKGIRAVSLGELIHNPAAVAALAQEGLTPIQDPTDAEGAILVIRSHGATPDTIAACRQSAVHLVDCTCPFVHHVHRLVSRHSQDGKPVIILGDPNHPEIIGIVGWCAGPSYIIQDVSQLDSLPAQLPGALLVSQTTFPPSAYDELLPALMARYGDLQHENTICQATSVRQAEAEELARQSDRMIVVGGLHSANTRKLAETCRKWCPQTHLVEKAADLVHYRMNPAEERIGITAGASTPAWSLKEVVDFMNDMELNGQTQKPETPDQAQEAQEVLESAAQDLSQQAQVAVEQVSDMADAAVEASQDAVQAAEDAVEDAAEAVEAAAEEEVSEAAQEAPDTAQEPEEAAATEATEDVVEEAAEAADEQPAAAAEEPPKEPSFMDAVAASMTRIRSGQTLMGKVVQITEDEVSVNIGYKSDGLLKHSDMVDTDVELGDEIEVEVIKVNDGEGNVILSQRNIVNRKVWADLMEKYEQGELVEAVGKEAVKGGLLASIEGVRAFIPASHLAQRYVDKISQFVGQDLKLKIIEVDESKKRVVASRKEALAQEMEVIKAAVWSQLEEGAVVRGIVRRFTNFGAFVDLGGVDGLIHVSDLSWNRNVVPSEVLQANQEVDVKILNLDRERDRIALGYKQLQPRPWDNVEEKYPVGSILTRTIVRVRPFGAFIELEPGVDGLVHISQVAHTRVDKIEDVVQPGQEVNVKVLSVDPVAKRISLSIREAMEDSALHYTADIPGESYGQDNSPLSSGYQSYQSSTPAPSASEDRPETALELAMRKAREELEAQENRGEQETQEAPEEPDAQETPEEPEAQETPEEPEAQENPEEPEAQKNLETDGE